MTISAYLSDLAASNGPTRFVLIGILVVHLYGKLVFGMRIERLACIHLVRFVLNLTYYVSVYCARHVSVRIHAYLVFCINWPSETEVSNLIPLICSVSRNSEGCWVS